MPLGLCILEEKMNVFSRWNIYMMLDQSIIESTCMRIESVDPYIAKGMEYMHVCQGFFSRGICPPSFP